VTAAATLFDMPPATLAGGQPVWCSIEQIRPHPAYAQLGLAPSTRSLSVLADRGDAVFQQPLIITRDRILVDGYARLRLGKQQGREQVMCLEYDWSEAQALEQLVYLHGRSDGLNDYVRIVLALPLEPALQAKAQANQQAGGQLKGSINLSEAEKVDVRDCLAHIAGVSPAYISRVKTIRETAHPDVLAALQSGEIRIDRGWQICKSSRERQNKLLREFRSKKGIKGTIRKLIQKHRSPKKPSELRLDQTLNALQLLDQTDQQAISAYVVKLHQEAVFITEALLDRAKRQYMLATEPEHAD
jgi:Spy/CpxP family protein refolding chaperone